MGKMGGEYQSLPGGGGAGSGLEPIQQQPKFLIVFTYFGYLVAVTHRSRVYEC
jgi:hypothetical protein